ncbi:MAG: Na/Pi cotransporter family protein [Rhodobacteraceae bacterium]|nr:Na/Pi cotransporter family protein [Paracoccaceae bacterium]
MPDLITLAGGVGLFLLGMQVLTDALRQLASRQMRAILARFTTSPLTGTLTGAATTAIIQSSSATMVTVIGFVGAGLMSFPHALGVIYGANIGTTMTGWIVAMVGLKLHLGTIALPLLLAATLARTVLHGRSAQVALTIAGFALVFVGLDMMQDAASGFERWLTPDRLPGDTLLGNLWLVAAGMILTIVIQSSSAGVATALVLVNSGAMSLEQAAAMVIGMTVGTTFTAILASVGGSRDMHRTAMAHLLYNVLKSVVAFALLQPLVAGLTWLFPTDAATALVMFHTLVNVTGAVIMLPLTAPFVRLIERLVPGGEASLTQALNPRLLSDPMAAMDGALACSDAISSVLFTALGQTLHPSSRAVTTAEHALQVEPALDELRDYLSRIQIPAAQDEARNRYSALLHMVDHLDRLAEQLTAETRIEPLLTDKMLRRPAQVLGAAARRAGISSTGMDAAKMARLTALIAGRTGKLRRSALLREHVGLVSVTGVFELTDAMRWLQRTAHNAARLLHYRAIAASEVPPKPLAERLPATEAESADP